MFRQGEGRTDDTMQIMLHRHQDERMELLATVENLNIEEAEIVSFKFIASVVFLMAQFRETFKIILQKNNFNFLRSMMRS